MEEAKRRGGMQDWAAVVSPSVEKCLKEEEAEEEKQEEEQKKRKIPCSNGRCVPQPFSHLLVCDFEATCDDVAEFPHEIIEFPVVCVDTAELSVVAEFHSYVRPTRHLRLTDFCTSLTGITQSQVDSAPTLPVVLQKFAAWLQETVYPLCQLWAAQHPGGLSRNIEGQKKKFAYGEANSSVWADCERMICMATDGPWDMRRFMYACSVLRDGHEFPPLFYRWVNVRHCFAEHFQRRPCRLTDMLKRLGLTFSGRQHSGIDDSRNIARVLVELLRRGYRVSHVSTINYIRASSDVAAAARAMMELDEEGDERERKQQHHYNKSKRKKKNRGGR